MSRRRPLATIDTDAAIVPGRPCQHGCSATVVWGWRGRTLCQFDAEPIEQTDLMSATYREHRCTRRPA